MTHPKKISFVVYYPYQWFIYKNIYNKLPPDKREVIADMSVHQALQEGEAKLSVTTLLQREGVSFRTITGVDNLNAHLMRKFFSNVEVIVSCWEFGCVSSKYAKDIKKVCTTYGLAKELTMLRPTRSLYDVILAYGKRDQQHFNLLTKSIAIGNPRLDNFYNGTMGMALSEKIRGHFTNAQKKTLLYAPTHGDLGSFHQMFNALRNLASKYNIIFKPHYITLREDLEIIEKYRSIPTLLIIDDTWDIIEAMAVSDVIVSDNSSAIFDAIQVDKPLIVCDFLDKQFLDFTHKNLRLKKTGLVGASTFSGGLEQQIKSTGLVRTIKDPDDLANMLTMIADADSNQRELRRTFVREHFAYFDGSSAQRASEIILHVYNTKRNHVQGILHHAYRTFNDRISRGLVEQRAGENESIAEQPNVLAWIFCDENTNDDQLLVTLNSLISDDAISGICVSGIPDEAIRGISAYNKFAEKNTAYFREHADGLRFVYSHLTKVDALLFTKTNTIIKKIKTVSNFKTSCARDIIFFSENIKSHPFEKPYNLFYLLKYEILGFSSISRNTLFTVSYEQIHALEKCAVYIESSVLLEHELPTMPDLSVEGLMSFFIFLDTLKFNEQHGRLCKDFVLMPNFFTNQKTSSYKDLFEKLTVRGLYLNRLGIPMREWPDNKIMKYVGKLALGDLRYALILHLVLKKIFVTSLYIFYQKLQSLLVTEKANDQSIVAPKQIRTELMSASLPATPHPFTSEELFNSFHVQAFLRKKKSISDHQQLTVPSVALNELLLEQFQLISLFHQWAETTTGVYSLSFGGLLGYRAGRCMLPYDDDLDFVIDDELAKQLLQIWTTAPDAVLPRFYKEKSYKWTFKQVLLPGSTVQLWLAMKNTSHQRTFKLLFANNRVWGTSVSGVDFVQYDAPGHSVQPIPTEENTEIINMCGVNMRAYVPAIAHRILDTHYKITWRRHILPGNELVPIYVNSREKIELEKMLAVECMPAEYDSKTNIWAKMAERKQPFAVVLEPNAKLICTASDLEYECHKLKLIGSDWDVCLLDSPKESGTESKFRVTENAELENSRAYVANLRFANKQSQGGATLNDLRVISTSQKFFS